MDLCLTSSSASPHELSIAVYHAFISLLLQTQYVPRIGGPQDHLQIWWVTRRTQHDSAYMSYSWLSFISLKGYNLISKKKPHEASPRKPGLNFQDISLSGVTQKALNSSSNELWHVWNVSQGSSLETQCSGFLLGDAHIGTQCLPCTKIPHSQKVFSVNHIVCINSLSVVWHSYEGMVRSLPHVQVPRSQPKVFRGPNTWMAELE